MTTEHLKQLLSGNKHLELVNDDQDAAYGLRLLVIDHDGNEVGLLAIEPCQLVLPDEAILDYSYQQLEAGGSHYPECDYCFQVEAPVEGTSRIVWLIWSEEPALDEALRIAEIAGASPASIPSLTSLRGQ